MAPPFSGDDRSGFAQFSYHINKIVQAYSSPGEPTRAPLVRIGQHEDAVGKADLLGQSQRQEESFLTTGISIAKFLGE